MKRESGNLQTKQNKKNKIKVKLAKLIVGFMLVVLLGLCSALHFNLSLLQKHLTDYTKKRRFLIFLLQLFVP